MLNFFIFITQFLLFSQDDNDASRGWKDLKKKWEKWTKCCKSFFIHRNEALRKIAFIIHQSSRLDPARSGSENRFSNAFAELVCVLNGFVSIYAFPSRV